MDEKTRVQFLLGPAGSGKTFRCLSEVRNALADSPDGEPLVFVAPKQATFQIERQLLLAPEIPGYTRLEILSFERLADFIADRCSMPAPKLLNPEGRLMVLRALLAQHRGQLKIFHSTARLPGFAQQLSSVLREFRQCRIGADKLRHLAGRQNMGPELAAKLHDIALLLEAYTEWLDTNGVRDSESYLDLAAAALNTENRVPLQSDSWRIERLWLDGFAEMTPQELALLAAVVPRCRAATLAFCIDGPPQQELPWLSAWSVIAQTFRRCHQEIAALPGVDVSLESLPRIPESGRFASSAVLQHLERHWAEPKPYSIPDGAVDSPAPELTDVRFVTCHNLEGEAIFAAREIIRTARQGVRFRDIAVLVRSLDRYYDILRRVFTRYEIPAFLDRREPVAHHPLAELTRFALRTICFGWQLDDWFAALKTGLVPAGDSEIDRLENESRSRGWQGTIWTGPLPGNNHPLEALRSRLVTPFLHLATALLAPPPQSSAGANLPNGNSGFNSSPDACTATGRQLAAALERFWADLNIVRRLEEWSAAVSSTGSPATSVHTTVWQQMNEWRENLALGFPNERITLREWLPILETGLSGLTVGVIPPALDQVLIGSVDRSRNPDLRIAFVLGLNESVFPAPPPKPVLLTETERAELENSDLHLGATPKQRLGHERYLGYIACTRPRERLVLTCAATGESGAPVNPSPIIAHVQQLFPSLRSEVAPPELDWSDTEHSHELIPHLLKNRLSDGQNPFTTLEQIEDVQPALRQWSQLIAAREMTRLPAASVEKLFGSVLRTSVSALEQFAACPFKFFVQSGLRARERPEFEVDHREKGSFQHAVLQEFHRELQQEGKRWRDITAVEARGRIARIGERLLLEFKDGLFDAAHDRRFAARLLIEQLQQFVATLVTWMAQYTFDPAAVELGFGFAESPLPGWEIDLGNDRKLVLRGIIDRVDLGVEPADALGARLVAVIDYKSSGRRLDPIKLHHGLELQLLSYLGVLRSLPQPNEYFSAAKLEPAGVFYVSLKGHTQSCKSRNEQLVRSDGRVDSPHQHTGRFNAAYLRQFDATDANRGDQFRYRLKRDGGLYASGNDALEPAAFNQLLDSIEEHLGNIGRRIYGGDVSVAPYRKGNETACDYCVCQPICRFDSWRDPFRVLRAPVRD